MEESELLQAKSSASENARAVINLQAELERLEADYKRDKHRLHEEGGAFLKLFDIVLRC